MATVDDIKATLRQLEVNVRKQIAGFKKGAEQGIIKIPIGPGPRRQLLKAVRKLRAELNRNLMKLEKALAPPKAKKKRAAR